MDRDQWKKISSMKLHDLLWIDSTVQVLKVYRGWIYYTVEVTGERNEKYRYTTSTFVSEF